MSPAHARPTHRAKLKTERTSTGGRKAKIALSSTYSHNVWSCHSAGQSMQASTATKITQSVVSRMQARDRRLDQSIKRYLQAAGPLLQRSRSESVPLNPPTLFPEDPLERNCSPSFHALQIGKAGTPPRTRPRKTPQEIAQHYNQILSELRRRRKAPRISGEHGPRGRRLETPRSPLPTPCAATGS
jgi:hypothetical protein